MLVWRQQLGQAGMGDLEQDLCLFAAFDTSTTHDAEVQKLSAALDRCLKAKQCALSKVLAAFEGQKVSVGTHMKNIFVDFCNDWANDKGSKLDLEQAVKIARSTSLPGNS